MRTSLRTALSGGGASRCPNPILPLAAVLLVWALAAANGSAVTVKPLVTFYGTNGVQPYAAMILAGDGNFYGTTSAGGAYGQGTVFRLTPSGVLTTLASLNGTNGAAPLAGLVQGIDGNFYGTASAGGTNGGGTLFMVTPLGQLTALANFGGTNGAQPQGTLVVSGAKGDLYGTTLTGGASGKGTIFMFTPPQGSRQSGSAGLAQPLRVSPGVLTVASFDGVNTGAYPAGGLAQGSGGSFYGTTSSGGSVYNAGTVFQFGSAAQILTPLFAFSSTNGAGSQAPLVLATNNLFYGTTAGGGTNDVQTGGDGTLFSIDANPYGGSFTSLCMLGRTNGASPFAGLVRGTDGNFYGAAAGGGSHGRGTLFNYNPSSATLTLLYSFTGGSDGAAPYGGLVQGTNGNFYGVTLTGGAGGGGTIYELSGFAPFILIQPTNSTVQSGTTVNLSVAAGGSAPLSYQWQMNSNNVRNGSSISGAATPSLSISNALAANSGSYQVIVKNAFGAVTSSPVTLTVVDPYGAGRPTLKISSPAQNTYLPTTAITVTGTTAGTVPVAQVYYKLNGTTQWTRATPANGWSAWTANVTLSPGTNRFQAYAVNLATTPSQTNSAYFVPGPFDWVAGTCNGLFYDTTNGVTETNAGFFTITTTYLGQLSGSLLLSSTRYSFSGQFATNGFAQALIPRTHLDPLVVRLQLDMTQGTDHLTGSVSNLAWFAELAGDRAVFDGRTSIAPQAGLYTLVFQGTNSNAAPAGDGWGTVTVNPAGSISLAGSLADGTAVTQSVPVSKNGQWPLYVSLYSGQGLLLGWLTFANNLAEGIQGDVVWVKPKGASGHYYPNGFTFQTGALGSPAPVKGVPLFNPTNLVLSLTGGNLARAITNHITVDAKNQIHSTNHVSLTFSVPAGTFTGSVVDPASLKSVSFNGVVLTNQNYALGYFLGTNQSGQVYVGP